MEWLPELGWTADLRVDRLGAFFLLLVGGVGLGVVQYSRHYFPEGGSRGYWGALLAFMGAMLGIVLADSLILLFIFWELTTVTSALLIGLDFEREDARRGAVQAFLVTGAGGLALLAGIVLVGQLTGSWSFSGLAPHADQLVSDPRHVVPLVLLLVGAFTKSAQFPFHFWLPGAMAAPAPVSAYLHSATMVKAGLILIARLFPIFHASPVWSPLLVTVGLATFVIAGWRAVRTYDLKHLLAYSTVANLGALTALYGFYTRAGAPGELLHLLSHALYKSSLFLLVGWLEKAAGTRDLSLLEREKWVQREPFGAVLVGIGALAMMGLPFLLGFLGKEMLFATVTGGKLAGITPALAATVLGSVLVVVYALKLFLGTFWGWRLPPSDRGYPPREISPWLLAVPGILLLPQLAGGLLPGWFLGAVLEPGAEWPPAAVWLHADAKAALSVAMLVAGFAGFLSWRRLAALPSLPGPQWLAERLSAAALGFSAGLGRLLQAGGHPRFLATTLLVAVLAMAGAVLAGPGRPTWPRAGWGPEAAAGWLPAAIVGAGALLTLVLRGRVAKVVALAVVGYGMAVLYVVFRAPDLALTQLLVETVSLILLLLAFRRLPRLSPTRSRPRRVLHGLVAGAVGCAMGALAWVAGSHAATGRAGERHLALSLPEGRGENVVNVILVDFRGMDTLAEVAVLVIAALGTLALGRAGAGAPPVPAPAPATEPGPPAAGGDSMRSLILRRVAQAVLPVALLFALYMLIRGHDEPGGGFIAGLITASALVLQALAFGAAPTRLRLARPLLIAAPAGLMLALATALAGVLAGDAWLTHYHGHLFVPGLADAHLSTTLVFDVGIYLVVVGVTAGLLSTFASEPR